MKTLLLTFFLALAFEPLFLGAQTQPDLNWPSGFSPEESSFYVENQIEIYGSPAEVWRELIRAEDWSSWYSGASDVQIQGESEEESLQAESSFFWKTMGLEFISEVREFVPESRLSWISSRKSIQGYHTWLIIPTSTGCRVITAESQNGWLTTMEKLFQPKKLHRLHEDWLRQLKARVENQQESTQPEFPIFK